MQLERELQLITDSCETVDNAMSLRPKILSLVHEKARQSLKLKKLLAGHDMELEIFDSCAIIMYMSLDNYMLYMWLIYMYVYMCMCIVWFTYIIVRLDLITCRFQRPSRKCTCAGSCYCFPCAKIEAEYHSSIHCKFILSVIYVTEIEFACPSEERQSTITFLISYTYRWIKT